MGRVLVPGQGVVGTRIISSAAEQFLAVGPIAVGLLISRVDVTVLLQGAVGGDIGEVGLALGSSGLASAEAFAGGSSLIDVGSPARDGHPSVGWFVVQSAAFRFVLYPGIWVNSGSLWVMARTEQLAGVDGAQLIVSVQTMRWASDGVP